MLCDSKSMKHMQWSNTWKQGGEWQPAERGSRGIRELLVERCKVWQNCHHNVLILNSSVFYHQHFVRNVNLKFNFPLTKQIRRQQIQKEAGLWSHGFHRVGSSLHLSSINSASKG